MSDTEDDWHDAASEVDLAEALQEWEEEQRWHDPDVDQAIQVGPERGRDVDAAWPGSPPVPGLPGWGGNNAWAGKSLFAQDSPWFAGRGSLVCPDA